MKPRRVHKEQLIVAIGADAKDRVTRCLGTICGDHQPLLQQRIEERRLPHVGPAYEGEGSAARFAQGPSPPEREEGLSRSCLLRAPARTPSPRKVPGGAVSSQSTRKAWA